MKSLFVTRSICYHYQRRREVAATNCTSPEVSRETSRSAHEDKEVQQHSSSCFCLYKRNKQQDTNIFNAAGVKEIRK